ncbi:WD repeat-containing protein 76-like [Cloeon dipterum]|uniref:WD repeat-containing protein 76-like n=1 Tax=Cloeon dipterum TaxID=197152 RepID=UPI00322019C0
MSHSVVQGERRAVPVRMKEDGEAKQEQPKAKRSKKIFSSSDWESEDDPKENEASKANRANNENQRSSKNNKFESELEKLRRKNIEARQKMLEQLKLFELKQEMEENVQQVKETRKCTKLEVDLMEPRRSDRIKSQQPVTYVFTPETRRGGINFDTTEKEKEDFSCISPSTQVLSLEDANCSLKVRDARKILLNLFPTPVESEERAEIAAEDQGEMELIPKQNNMESLENFQKKIGSLTFTEQNSSKFVSQIITSLAFNPMTSSIVVAAGSHSGKVSLWKLASEDESATSMLFGFHSSSVDCISFDASNHHLMYSSSSNGSFYESDLNKQSFSLVCESGMRGKSWHSQVKPKVFLLSQGCRGVAIVDLRQESTRFTTYRCKDEVICASAHPVDMYFATLSMSTKLAIWDVRQTKEELSSVSLGRFSNERGRSCFFSPVTGNLALVTTNKFLNIVDTRDLDRPKLHLTYPSSNSDRKVAIWHPQREDVFLTGSLEKLDLFQVGHAVEPLTSLSHKCDIRSTRASEVVFAFHPSMPAVAVGNANGKVSVLM